MCLPHFRLPLYSGTNSLSSALCTTVFSMASGFCHKLDENRTLVVIMQWVVVNYYQCNIPSICTCKPAKYKTQHTKLTGALWCSDNSHHTLWILVYCTFVICSENCEGQTTSHQNMSRKMPAVLHAQCTCHRVEITKPETELARPYFCTQVGLTVSDFCCIILL
jgi:hypothetical protein